MQFLGWNILILTVPLILGHPVVGTQLALGKDPAVKFTCAKGGTSYGEKILQSPRPRLLFLKLMVIGLESLLIYL